MPKAELFITCLGDQFHTFMLQSMTYIPERLGVELIFPTIHALSADIASQYR